MKTQEKTVEYKNSTEQISNLLKANMPYLWVTTHEEERFTKNLFTEVIEKQNKELWTWSAYQGLVKYDPEAIIKRASGDMDKTWQPNIALEAIDKYERPKNKTGSIFLMRDFHTVLTQPIPRMMRDLYQSFIRRKKALILVSNCLAHGPSGTKSGIEPTLDKQISVVPYELPNRGQIETHVRNTVYQLQDLYQGKKVASQLDYKDDDYNKFAMALQGLTELEIDNAIVGSLCHLKKIDENKLLLEKKQIIQRSDILEYEGQTTAMKDVGGLDLAKKYFDAYSDQFSPEARAYGVEPLRGVLLTGIPGCGKSLISRAISHMWSLPLLTLDIGRVMSGLVGSSEQRMREAIAQVESIAPCILRVDEIEKSLSGTKSSGNTDGGTLSRVFGTLLTAMEEGMEGVVVLATANDISALPPELIRRFNEVLFVDLPYPEEREEIFEIHLGKRGRNLKKLKLDIDELVAATHLFTGSEIEKVIKEAIARAFRQKEKDVTTEIILSACNDTKPIAKVMKEKIDSIRDWARSRARYASSLAEEANAPGNQKVTTKSGKELDLSGDLDDLDEVVKTSKEKAKEEHKNTGGNHAQLDNILDD